MFAPVYLDHNATTPLDPLVREAMLPWLGARFGNASSRHEYGRAARKAIDEARSRVAAAVNAHPTEVIFTSGGSEANNLFIKGAAAMMKPGLVALSAIEHPCVREPARQLMRSGWCCEEIAVDGSGRIDPQAFDRVLADKPRIVSVMLANNETGVLNDLDAVAEVVRSHGPEVPRTPLHTDAVQAAAWLDLSVAAAAADLVSVSGHKLGGPKGIGALIVRQPTQIRPLVLGGGQERGRRSGTSNVAGIVGLAAALDATAAERAATNSRIAALRDRLGDGLAERIPGSVVTVPAGAGVATLPGICHVCIAGVDAETLLFLMESDGVVASAASSCSSGAQRNSHVLAAMGVPDDLAKGSLRLSLGWDSTDADVDRALEVVPAAVRRVLEFA